jgi:hypothetical protein
MDGTPLNISFDAGLDAALTKGWSGWIETARKKGIERTSEWLLRRVDAGLELSDLEPLLETLLHGALPFDRAMAASELAELTELEDDAMAATLWEGVMISGREAADSEVYFEGLSQLAEIELEYGDPQAAAALYIDFLNWARESGNSTEAEAILTAFDQIIEMSESDGAPTASANYAHAQTRFFRSVDGDDSRIVSGNWEANDDAYVVWDD